MAGVDCIKPAAELELELELQIKVSGKSKLVNASQVVLRYARCC